MTHRMLNQRKFDRSRRAPPRILERPAGISGRRALDRTLAHHRYRYFEDDTPTGLLLPLPLRIFEGISMPGHTPLA